MVALRLAELLAARELSAYELAKRSNGRISKSVAYRLAQNEWRCLSASVIDALCDVLEVAPAELFAPTARKRRR